MNYIKISLLSLTLLTLSSCFTNKLIPTEEAYVIDEAAYTITLINVAQNNMMNSSMGPGYYNTVKNTATKEPGKFFKATIVIKNNTNQTKEIDLREVLLCGEDKTCLQAYEYHMKSIVDGYVDAVLDLKGGKEKGRELYYMGSKKFVPKYLINQVSGKFIEFTYEQ